MRKGILLSITALILAGVGVVAAVNSQGPMLEQLSGDISEVDHQLGLARGLAPKYQEGSILRTQVDLEIAFLETTKAMLDQKRRSLLRGISLSYAVNGLALKPASSDAVSSIQKEIGIAQADVDAAEARASRYTGGILQVTTLMEAQTNRVRASVLKLQLAIAVLGLATVPQGQEAGLPHAPAVGHTVDDKGAL